MLTRLKNKSNKRPADNEKHDLMWAERQISHASGWSCCDRSIEYMERLGEKGKRVYGKLLLPGCES